MELNPEIIISALQKELPGSVSHHRMNPPERKLEIPSDKTKIKYSSVLLLLFKENEKIIACLIKRPEHMKHHAGQIAIPGGRIENNETAIETAFRETFEEIGIQKNDVQILGSLSDLYVGVSRFLIKPFVGWLDKKPEFTISQDEVEKVVLFPFWEYRNSFEDYEIETLTGKLRVPCIKFENEIIWGATAMILSELYDILDPK